MAKSATSLSKELISMAASVAYLSEMEAVVRKKPVFPKAVIGSMGPAAAEMDTLLNHFNLVREKAAQCADPVVQDYLAVALKKNVGDMASGTFTIGRGTDGSVVKFNGVLSKVAIWLPGLPEQRARSLYFQLSPASLAIDGRPVRTAAEYGAWQNRFSYYMKPLHALDTPDGLQLVYACPLNETPILV